MNFPKFVVAMMAIGESAKGAEHSTGYDASPVMFNSNLNNQVSNLQPSLHISDAYNSVPIEQMDVQLNATVLNALGTLNSSDEFKLIFSSPSLKLKKKQTHQVSLRDNKLNSKAALRGTKEDITEYTTLDFESADGKTHAHCAIYPDGTQVSCLQYTYHGVANTTVVVVNPGDGGLHTVLNIPHEKQLEINRDLHQVKSVFTDHDIEGRRLAEAEQTEVGTRTLSNANTAATKATMTVAFTDQAVNTLGGVEKAKAQAALQVSLTNTVLRNSKINLVLSLASVITGVTDVGNSYDNLMHAGTISRTTDFLSLITGGGHGYGSIGFQYQYKPATVDILKSHLASVVVVSDLINKSFQHEFGHIIGGQHQLAAASSPARFPYAYAFASIDQTIGTVLAYINNPSDRLPAYSSATGVYAGQKVGSANENNAEAMRISIAEIIQFLRGMPDPKTSTPTQTKSPRPTVATYKPSVRPSSYPTHPTGKPTTAEPSSYPSKASKVPTIDKPTTAPSSYPTKPPTTNRPTSYPTTFPTPPTFVPTNRPTNQPRHRGLEELEKEVVAIFNFADYVLSPDTELNKLLNGENIKVLGVIASSSENIQKFIHDAVDSLGEKGAYELMKSGVLEKIFGFTKADVAKTARKEIEDNLDLKFIADLIPTKRVTYH